MMFKKGDEAVCVTSRGSTENVTPFTVEHAGPKYVTFDGRKYVQSDGFLAVGGGASRVFTASDYADYVDRQTLSRAFREIPVYGRDMLTPASVRNLLAAFRREGLVK